MQPEKVSDNEPSPDTDYVCLFLHGIENVNLLTMGDMLEQVSRWRGVWRHTTFELVEAESVRDMVRRKAKEKTTGRTQPVVFSRMYRVVASMVITQDEAEELILRYV